VQIGLRDQERELDQLQKGASQGSRLKGVYVLHTIPATTLGRFLTADSLQLLAGSMTGAVCSTRGMWVVHPLPSIQVAFCICSAFWLHNAPLKCCPCGYWGCSKRLQGGCNGCDWPAHRA